MDTGGNDLTLDERSDELDWDDGVWNEIIDSTQDDVDAGRYAFSTEDYPTHEEGWQHFGDGCAPWDKEVPMRRVILRLTPRALKDIEKRVAIRDVFLGDRENTQLSGSEPLQLH